jgi:hypothetical protein
LNQVRHTFGFEEYLDERAKKDTKFVSLVDEDDDDKKQDSQL